MPSYFCYWIKPIHLRGEIAFLPRIFPRPREVLSTARFIFFPPLGQRYPRSSPAWPEGKRVQLAHTFYKKSLDYYTWLAKKGSWSMSSKNIFLYEWSERDVPIKDVLNGRESWATLLNGKDASATSFSKILLVILLESKSLDFVPVQQLYLR